MDIKKEFGRFPEERTAYKYKWLIYRLFGRLHSIFYDGNKTVTNLQIRM